MQNKVNKLDFSGQSFYVGIDVHKKSWKVTVMSQEMEHKTFSQDPDSRSLVNYLERKFPGATYKAVYEAGFSGFGLYRELSKLGVECVVAHPADIPTQQKEKMQKDDQRDSRKLCKGLRGGMLEGIYVPDEQQLADRSLVRCRSKLVKDLSRVKNRVKSLLMFHGIETPSNFSQQETRHWSKRYMEWLRLIQIPELSLKIALEAFLVEGTNLRQQILLVTRHIRQLSQSDRYRENISLLLGMPGIGIITGMVFLTEIGDFKRFKRFDDLCSYVGLIPSTSSSGEKESTGQMTLRGKKYLKISLIESSWTAVAKDPALMLKFGELSKRMAKNKAIIRIAKSLLNRMRHIVTKKEEYQMGVVS